MKTCESLFLMLLFVVASAFESFGQSDMILADAKPFQYLIGMTYTDISDF